MSAEHLFQSMKVIKYVRQLIQTSDMMVPNLKYTQSPENILNQYR